MPIAVQEPENKRPDGDRWTPKGSSSLMVALLKKAAAEVRSGVELHFFGSGANPSASLEGLHLCQMLRDAGPSIALNIYDEEADKDDCSNDAVLFFPTTIMRGRKIGPLRFLGAFSGWELKILSEALALASGGESGLAPRTREMLASLKSPLVLKVFASVESEHCVRPAALAMRMAAASSMVSAEVINASDFPVMSQRYRVENPPRTVVNDIVEFDGAPGETAFLEKVLGALVPQGGIYR
jgi:hypothetical protein